MTEGALPPDCVKADPAAWLHTRLGSDMPPVSRPPAKDLTGRRVVASVSPFDCPPCMSDPWRTLRFLIEQARNVYGFSRVAYPSIPLCCHFRHSFPPSVG